jgi:hypothetical protein
MNREDVIRLAKLDSFWSLLRYLFDFNERHQSREGKAMNEPMTSRQLFEQALKEKYPQIKTECFVDGNNRLTDIYCSQFARYAWVGWKLAYGPDIGDKQP